MMSDTGIASWVRRRQLAELCNMLPREIEAPRSDSASQ